MMYIFRMGTMTISEARAALPEVIDRVADGEEMTITRHGRAVAVVVRPDILWSRGRAEEVIIQADSLHKLLADAGTGAGADSEPGLTEKRAEELISAIRAGRDGR
jgi:antitoxin (DNA-binding transcriptional repressor) of toxin-antitoxin stability system